MKWAVFFSFGFICKVVSAQAIDSVYVGLLEICWTDKDGVKECFLDPGRPKWKWYHYTVIKFSKDSVFVEQTPVMILKKDTLFSSSDGGFYFYTGSFSKKGTILLIDLVETYCDYCGVLTELKEDGTRAVVQRRKKIEAIFKSKKLSIDGQTFRKL